MRAQALKHSQISPNQAGCKPQRKPCKYSLFAPDLSPKLKILFTFALFGLRKSRGNTRAPQINLYFCHFSAYFSPFAPVRGAPIVKGCPDAVRPQERKPTRKHGKKRQGKGAERESRGKPTSPQAHKKGVPPIWQGTGSPSPHHKFAPKNQQKVTWVDLKKFSEKFFGGMFRGKEKPLALSQRKGSVVKQMKTVK